MTILGATMVCYPLACLRVEDLPVVIPPGSARPVRVKALTRDEGDFLGPITLFTNCTGKTEFVLHVSGAVTKPRNSNMIE